MRFGLLPGRKRSLPTSPSIGRGPDPHKPDRDRSLRASELGIIWRSRSGTLFSDGRPPQMIRTVRGRLGDSGFGETCQPACSSGGTLCPDPAGFLSSLNPCCLTMYTASPNDGYCGGGNSPAVTAITSQIGGLQDLCTAGGLLCPQPNSPGASLNPCCLASAASSQASSQTTSSALPSTFGPT